MLLTLNWERRQYYYICGLHWPQNMPCRKTCLKSPWHWPHWTLDCNHQDHVASLMQHSNQLPLVFGPQTIFVHHKTQSATESLSMPTLTVVFIQPWQFDAVCWTPNLCCTSGTMLLELHMNSRTLELAISPTFCTLFHFLRWLHLLSEQWLQTNWRNEHVRCTLSLISSIP